jgi:hypothetical protein
VLQFEISDLQPPWHPAWAVFFEDIPMESFRQALGAVYVALAEAAGGDEVLDRANGILADAVDTGAIDDPYARSAIRALVRASSKKMEAA